MKLLKHVVAILLVALAYSANAQWETYREAGVASYYHDKFVGRKTANGEKFSQKKYTCAHKNLPFGTQLRVTNLSNGKTVIVTVNDRGPFTKGRIIDLSTTAAKELDFMKAGITKVTVELYTEEPELENIPCIVLNDSLKSVYCANNETAYLVKLGDVETTQHLNDMAQQVSNELGCDVMVQKLQTEQSTSYLVFVGVFYRQEEADSFLDMIENYYPDAEVAQLALAD